MKKVLLLMLIFTAFSSGAQDFCGHIRYRYTYFRTKDNKDITSKTDDFKTEDFYICGNKFKVYFDGELKSIYIGDSLTYFHLRPDSAVAFLKADSAYGEESPNYTNLTKNVTYKGKVYNSFELDSEGDKTTYYYNDDVRIDPRTYQDLELYHWNKFFNTTNGGLRLVSIDRNKQITGIAEAIIVERLALRDEDFAPPPGYVVRQYLSFEILK